MSPAAVNEVILRDPFHRGLARYGTFKGFTAPSAKRCRGCGKAVRGATTRDFCSYRCTKTAGKTARKVEPVGGNLAMSEKEIAEAQARVGSGRWSASDPRSEPTP